MHDTLPETSYGRIHVLVFEGKRVDWVIERDEPDEKREVRP